MAAVPAPDGRGLVYKGKWKVLHPLTETDRSYIFMGTPLQGGSPVAIKVLKERRAKDSRFMKLHHADMQSALALPRHPGLVPCFDAGWVNGRYVAVSEFCPGKPLSARLGEPRPVPYPALLAATRQVVGLLDFAHQAGIRFRHIEPEHLIFDEEARALRLLRFSIPRSARLGIAAPSGVDADIHLAGHLLYRMLCQQSATGKESELAEVLADRVRSRCAAAYPEITPGEAHELATVFLRATTRDQERRFQTLAELDEALAALERGHEPLRQEQVRREREQRRDSMLATAYDTVVALSGGRGGAREDSDDEEDDRREARIQRFLLASTALMFLSLAVSLLF